MRRRDVQRDVFNEAAKIFVFATNRFSQSLHQDTHFALQMNVEATIPSLSHATPSCSRSQFLCPQNRFRLCQITSASQRAFASIIPRWSSRGVA